MYIPYFFLLFLICVALFFQMAWARIPAQHLLYISRIARIRQELQFSTFLSCT